MIKKTLVLFLLMTSLLLSDLGYSQVIIDITRASKASYPIAIDTPFTSTRRYKSLTVEDTFNNTLQSDLMTLNVFRFIPKQAFLEKNSEKKFTAQNIDFANWAVLDALALIKTEYSKRSDGKYVVHAKLFNILSKSLLLEKKYAGSIVTIDSMAHKFADEVVETLTGESGFFNSTIAFICKPGRHKELCTMDIHGKNVQQITRDNSIVLSPSWDKKRNKLYYTAFKNKNIPRVYGYDFATKRHTPMVAPKKGMMIGLDIDPWGQFLATTLTKDGNPELYLLSLNGNIAHRLTTHWANDVSPSFSPDGKKIAFISNRNGSVQVFVMPRNGGTIKQLTFKGKDNTSPAWSPDSKYIAFAGMDTDGHYDIFTFDVENGTLPIRRTYDSKDNIDPTWSPGGHLIAFASNRSGTYQIWTMRPDGTNQKQISKNSSWHHSMPKWSPNN
ncbi:MAG TPA: hypothetical protein PKC21_04430 [Oligoflexia bacterium]|nr:hypothetical protein [Oligoflexia bacterium]HMR24584.1 hypothetical protein [Oligoflexia bacterium]